MKPYDWTRPRFGALLVAAGAAMALNGCVVPVPPSASAPERQSSMLASDATCPGEPVLGPRFEQPVDPARPDQQLVAEALRQLVNRERCRIGTGPLGLSLTAVQAAGGHARVMAKHDFMAHTSPVAGSETLERRLRASKSVFGYAAENVARAPVTVLDSGDGGCLAPAAAPGAAPPTYAEVARGLFDMWIVSRQHAENILNPRYQQVGAGIGVNPLKHRCGEIAAAMVFTD